MVAAELPDNASLAELLSARARRTPRDRLAIDIIGGVLISAAALWARPAGWVAVGAAGACFAAYGVWAIAEVRLLSRAPDLEEDPRAALWHTVQGAAAAFGLGAFGLLLFGALGVAFGTAIS